MACRKAGRCPAFGFVEGVSTGISPLLELRTAARLVTKKAPRVHGTHSAKDGFIVAVGGIVKLRVFGHPSTRRKPLEGNLSCELELT